MSGTFEEEPADIYYARVRDGVVAEVSLTEDDTPSVCGCCRPHVSVEATGEVTAAFRNTISDGYRDIFRVSGSLDLGFTQPRRVGPPLWELSGCPMAGPLVVGQETLWNDASTGERRTLLASGSDGENRVLVESGEELSVLYPPRPVSGDDRAGPLFLVPADPTGRLIRRGSDKGWEVLPDTIPSWVTSAALVDGELLVAGTIAGELKIRTLALSP